MSVAKPSDFFSGICSKRRFAEREFEGIGNVRIRSINELERRQWQMGTLDKDGNVDMAKVPLAGPRLMTIAIVDEKDNRQFIESDAERLVELDAGTIGRIVEWIQSHCGIDDVDIEDTVGNSSGIPSADSQ